MFCQIEAVSQENCTLYVDTDHTFTTRQKKLYLATASNKPCNLKPQNIQVNLLNFLGIRLDLKYHVR
jgi:hypothetical protein